MRVLIFSILILFGFFANVFSQPPVKIKNVTGDVFRYENFPSKYIEARNVDVWLPPGYDSNKNRKYAVLYMHDGQNIFNPDDSVSGVDWGVDETMTRLINENKISDAIVVGIWNSARRIVEFMPSKAIDLRNKKPLKDNSKVDARSAESDKYLKFLVSELKPFIDRNYRTLSNRKNTYLMGSSMGGLISLYALGEYPDVFGGAASLSTHFPAARGVIIDYLEKFPPSPKKHRIYFDYGTRGLDSQYESFQKRADELMRKNGFVPNKNWITRKFTGADHDENSWRKRLEIPLIFLFGK